VLALAALVAAFLGAGGAVAQGADSDLDGVPDAEDNCARVYNPDQEDHDQDRVGTTCDSAKGVPPDESAVVLYLRDQNGRPVRDVCFTVSIEGTSSGEPLDVCSDEMQPGFVLVRADPSTDSRAEIVQAELPAACTGGLGGTRVHETAAGKWEVVQLRYRCGAAATDSDRDASADESDNCPTAFNPDQEDADEDGFGNTCDPEPGVLEDESHVVFYMRDQDGLAVSDVCFEVTEVRTDETLEPAQLCSESSMPGYLVIPLDAGAVRIDVARSGPTLPGCRSGLAGRQSFAFAAGSWRVVDVRFTCGLPVTFTDRLSATYTSEQHSLRIVRSTRRIELRLRWPNARRRFDVTGITFGDAAWRLAAGARAQNRLRITRQRTRTSLLIRIEKVRPGKVQPGAPSVAEQLAFTVVARRVAGTATVATRVTQYRARR
jgi:hypothetical protein